MKTIELTDVVVKDSSGLHIELLRKDFDVTSIGVTENSTIVYVHDDEEKDPRELAEAWAKRPAPSLSRSEDESRRRAWTQLKEEAKKSRQLRVAARVAAEAAQRERERAEIAEETGMAILLGPSSPTPEAMRPVPLRKEGFMSKFFKVLRK